MARVNHLITNFTAGELSPRLDVRVDIAKYRNGLRTLINGIVMPHGGVRKRPGTIHVAEVKNSTNKVRLVPFEFSTTQAYILEFGPLYIRVYANNARIESGGSPVEITTTYTVSDVADLSFTQSADTLYIASANHPLATLTRTSNTAWTLADAAISNGPFLTINSDKQSFLGIAIRGSDTITAATQTNPVQITISGSFEAEEGAYFTVSGVVGMTELNGNGYVLRNISGGTADLYDITDRAVDGTGYTTYVSDGTLTGAVTPFGTYSQGSQITVTSTDGLFSADSVGQLFRVWEPGQASGIEAPKNDGAAFTNNKMYTVDGKVYGIANLTGGAGSEISSFPNHEEGVVRVSNSNETFRFDAVYLHDISCIFKVTAYTSATEVSGVIVRNHMPKSVIDYDSSLWEAGAWSISNGYPSRIILHESRLWAASTSQEPQKVWASKTGAFLDFLDGTDDDDGLAYEIASSKVDVVQWMASGRVLSIGTASGEYAVSASSRNEALTPSNVRIQKQTPYGTATADPVSVSNATIFVQRHGDPANEGKRIREFTYAYENDAYVAPDLTILSEHITGDGIDNLTYQASPDSIIWAARADGQLVGVTYEREQEVVGWHRHVMGGSSVDIESIAQIPGAYGDELWLSVKRRVDGVLKRYVEYMHRGSINTDDLIDSVYLDSALQYSGAETTTLTGLDHLDGEEVYVFGSNDAGTMFVQGPYEVLSGSITMDHAFSTATAGLPYTLKLETLDLEAGAQMGSARGQRKRIATIILELYRSLGGQYGRNTSNLTDIAYRNQADVMGGLTEEHTGLIEVGFDSGWSDDPRIRIEHSDPLPFTLLAILAEMETSG